LNVLVLKLERSRDPRTAITLAVLAGRAYSVRFGNAAIIGTA
jgi:hypothetical protein